MIISRIGNQDIIEYIPTPEELEQLKEEEVLEEVEQLIEENNDNQMQTSI